MVSPMVHPQLVDIIIRFRMHHIALVADVSKMYRSIELQPTDHRFVWRTNPRDGLKDYRMTQVILGVSTSSFIANICVKRNATDFTQKYPLAARISFYVDKCLCKIWWRKT